MLVTYLLQFMFAVIGVQLFKVNFLWSLICYSHRQEVGSLFLRTYVVAVNINICEFIL